MKTWIEIESFRFHKNEIKRKDLKYLKGLKDLKTQIKTNPLRSVWVHTIKTSSQI
jgi:hypothetical protein